MELTGRRTLRAAGLARTRRVSGTGQLV
jgi:hypothetical protein